MPTLQISPHAGSNAVPLITVKNCNESIQLVNFALEIANNPDLKKQLLEMKKVDVEIFKTAAEQKAEDDISYLLKRVRLRNLKASKNERKICLEVDSMGSPDAVAEKRGKNAKTIYSILAKVSQKAKLHKPKLAIVSYRDLLAYLNSSCMLFIAVWCNKLFDDVPIDDVCITSYALMNC